MLGFVFDTKPLAGTYCVFSGAIPRFWGRRVIACFGEAWRGKIGFAWFRAISSTRLERGLPIPRLGLEIFEGVLVI